MNRLIHLYLVADIPAVTIISVRSVSHPVDLVLQENLELGTVRFSRHSIQDWVYHGVDGQDDNSHPGIGL